MLPVDSNGDPDYEYMEKFMTNLEHKKRKYYLNSLKQGADKNEQN